MAARTAYARKWKSDLRAKRKADRCCLDCGEQLEPEVKGNSCPACVLKRSQRRVKGRYQKLQQAALALGFCRYHPDREAVPGATMCAYCLEYYATYGANWAKENRAAAIKRGDCSICFKEKARKGFRTCIKCKRKADARRARKLRIRELAPEGMTLLQVRRPFKKGA